MIIEAITGSAGLQALKPQWEILSEKTGIANVFLSWEWLSLWWEQYGAGKRLRILCGIEDTGEIAAIAPLMLCDRRMKGITVRCVEFIGSGEITPDHLGFICHPQALPHFSRLVFDYLNNAFREWDALRFTDMREEEALADAARSVFRRSAAVEYAHKGVCPYALLPSSWEEYTRALTSGRRQRIGKYERDLLKSFTVDFSLCDNADALVPLMARLEELHTQRMRQKKFDERKATLQGGFWEFQRRFALRMLEKRRLVMGTLKLNGDPAACMYGFVSGQTMFFYLSGIDVRYEKYSVGFVNIIHLIREAFHLGIREVDFLRGEEPYKFYFTRMVRNNTELVVWRGNPRTWYVRVINALVSFSKKTIKRLKSVLVAGQGEG